MEEDQPRPTGKYGEVTLAGKVFPWEKGQPVLVLPHGSEELYLPLFSSPEILQEMMGKMGISYERIKQVGDVGAFLSSVQIGLMVDPYFTPEGRIRWFQVYRQDA